MPINVHDETDLLTVLYDGALEQPRWATFLARLRRRATADHVSLLIRPADAPGDHVIEHGSGGVPPAFGAMAALYRRAPALYHALRPGRVYAGPEFLDPGNADHALHRRTCLAPPALAQLRLMRISEPAGSGAWLILARGGDDFSAATGALLSALGAHLSIAVRLSGALERSHIGARVATAGLGRLGIGWLTIDARGRVIDRDDQADRIFARHAQLRGAARDPRGEEFATILRRPDALPQAVRLSSEPRIDILIVPLPPDAMSGGAVAAVYVDAEENPGASTREGRCEAVQALFGLPHTEARLVEAISRGEGIAQAATRIGITEQTARTYSKRIYARTATSGQADLARLVLTGLAGLT